MFIIRRMLQAAVATVAVATTLLMLVIPVYAVVVIVILLIAMACKRVSKSSGAHGTARWADVSDMRRAGMLDGGNGLILGTVEGKVSRIEGVKALFSSMPPWLAVQTFLTSCQRKQSRQLVRLNQAVHTAVFAPSGAGKNVSIVEPLLLTCPESAVVIDFKGENAVLTAAHRARAFGHQIVMLDPFKLVTSSPATLNVLDGIDPMDPASFEQIDAIAEAIVVKEVNEHDPHWTQKAQIFIAGVITAVVHICPPDRRSLQEVAQTMADKNLLAQAITCLKKSTAHDGLVSRRGHEMSVSSDKELDGILSTANRALNFLSSPAIAESTTATSGFNPTDLGSRPMTVYLIIPMHLLRSQAAVMRLWVTALLRTVVARGAGNSRPVHMVLDEIAQLGRLEAVEDMLTIGRGYGIKITAIFQSMSQLKKVFPAGQEGVLLSNTTQVFFAVQDLETAKFVSERLGEETITVAGGGTNTGWSNSPGQNGETNRSYSGGASSSWAQQARRLLKPEEVSGLDPRIALTFAPGSPPIGTYLVRYYEPEFMAQRHIGATKAFIDATCLLLCSVVAAVGVTALILK